MRHLVIALTACVLAVGGAEDLEWWQRTVLYQVYPRSFKDSDGDGMGDLQGIIEKMDHIKDAGADAFWMSPIFTSPGVDSGYDISNYTEIDPMFGTMEDFEDLIYKANELDLKVLLDLVPNHVSNESEWFVKSVQRIEPYTNYFVWADPKYDENGTRLPPNNWLSYFGGSAWEWREERQQYYLHQFVVQQPDLNYRYKPVAEEIKGVMRFWLDKGVHGFRVDAVSCLYEDRRLRDEPPSGQNGTAPDQEGSLSHVYTHNQPGNYELIHQWREVVDEYTRQDGVARILITEGDSGLNYTFKYYGPKTRPGAHLNFNLFLFQVLYKDADAFAYNETINTWLEHKPDHCWPNWLVGNHDNARVATRAGQALVDAVNAVLLWLPGTAITYNGEEIGMNNTHVSWNQTVDPPGRRAGPQNYSSFSRDPERTPFQWDNSTSAGFSSSNDTWLPVNSNYKQLNLQQQQEASESHYKVYKQLVAERKSKTLQKGKTIAEAVTKEVFALVRELDGEDTYILAVNLGNETTRTDLTASIPSLPTSAAVVVASVGSGFIRGEILNTTEISIPSKGFVGLKGSPMKSHSASFSSSPSSSESWKALFFFFKRWDSAPTVTRCADGHACTES
ncbi:maltase 2-like [Bacillus rossius redtenbacheri]|uniref:maltase 2-like n=1 Tax=Bacillus rossius redtenbacheri TaxID=93214 RepID=UPI002FDEC45F